MADVSQTKIEKGVPLPRNPGRCSSGAFSIFDQLDIGDSVFFADNVKTIQSSVHTYGRARRRKMATRSVTENGVAGVRVWRVA